MNHTIANLYVFGSCLRVDAPNDIDLLWVYDENRFNTLQAIEFVRQKTRHLQLLSNIPIHNTILSKKEETGTCFITASYARHLCSWATADATFDNCGIDKLDVFRVGKGLKVILKRTKYKGNDAREILEAVKCGGSYDE